MTEHYKVVVERAPRDRKGFDELTETLASALGIAIVEVRGRLEARPAWIAITDARHGAHALVGALGALYQDLHCRIDAVPGPPPAGVDDLRAALPRLVARRRGTAGFPAPDPLGETLEPGAPVEQRGPSGSYRELYLPEGDPAEALDLDLARAPALDGRVTTAPAAARRPGQRAPTPAARTPAPSASPPSRMPRGQFGDARTDSAEESGSGFLAGTGPRIAISVAIVVAAVGLWIMNRADEIPLTRTYDKWQPATGPVEAATAHARVQLPAGVEAEWALRRLSAEKHTVAADVLVVRARVRHEFDFPGVLAAGTRLPDGGTAADCVRSPEVVYGVLKQVAPIYGRKFVECEPVGDSAAAQVKMRVVAESRERGADTRFPVQAIVRVKQIGERRVTDVAIATADLRDAPSTELDAVLAGIAFSE